MGLAENTHDWFWCTTQKLMAWHRDTGVQWVGVLIDGLVRIGARFERDLVRDVDQAARDNTTT